MAVAILEKQDEVKKLQGGMFKFELTMIFVALLKIYGEEGERVYTKLKKHLLSTEVKNMTEAELVSLFCSLVKKDEQKGEEIFDKLLSILF